MTATSKASVSGKEKNSPYRLKVSVTPRGVFFDRLGDEKPFLVLHTTERKARRLAQWILDNTEEE